MRRRRSDYETEQRRRLEAAKLLMMSQR